MPICGKTILIADDEPHIRYLLEFKLRQVGFTVIIASNGRQAFDLAVQHKPDLLVTDFQMPGGNGLDLCKQLRANPETAAIPALMLTARAHRVPTSDLEQTNIKTLIAKPFSPRELISQIKEVLGLIPHGDRKGNDDSEATAA